MITLALSFNFETQQQADTAVDLLAQSFNHSETDGEKLPFVKARIAALLKERIVAQHTANAQATATQQAAQLMSGATAE
jgi:hypothetical protein